jgi:hypothetical protein
VNIFKELLLESSTNLADKLKAIYDGTRPARVTKAKEALDMLEKAVAADSIFNVDFGEIKDILSRSLEEVLSFHLDDISDSDNRDASTSHLLYMADISYYVYLNQAKGQVKKIKEFLAKHHDLSASDKEVLKKLMASNEAAAEVFDIMTKLKPKIIKGRKPNTNIDPDKFQSRLGSKEAQKIVQEKLEAGIKEPMDDYEAAVEKWLQGFIDSIVKSDTFVYSNDNDPIKNMVFNRCFKSEREHGDRSKTEYKNVKLDPTKKDFAKDEAKAQRDGIEKRYLIKNIKKLSHVIDLKGNLSKIEELPYRKPKIGSGSQMMTIESGFIFEFADSSEFKVINKIVTKYSYAGKQFEQFPTTFHEVKFPDGTSMKSPSEEKMVTEFGSWNPK